MKLSCLDKRAQCAFTLAEVLAALLFMAIVIPVAVEGLRIASRAGEVAERKTQAARIAERVLNECLVLTNWNKALQNGTAYEGSRDFRWTLRNEKWNQDANTYAPTLVTVEVTFPVQGQDYSVRLATLASTLQQ
jgi:type II secretory pathway pseudopilin PulG